MPGRRRADRRRILIAAPSFHPWDLGTYLQRLLAARGIEHATFAYRSHPSDESADRGLLMAARDFHPDVVLGLKLGRSSPDTLARLRRRGAVVALWYVDCFDGTVPPQIARLLPEVDVFFTSAAGMVPRYRALTRAPVHWVHEGVHLPSFPPLRVPVALRATYASEVAFVGNVLHPPVADRRLALRRLHLLRKVAARHRLKVWGPQGDRRIGRLWRGVPAPILPWPAYNEELVRICRSADVVLGVNTIETVERYFSNRTFLTLASGGFLLTHHVPGLETMFENGRHLVWFRSDDECLDLLRHWLARPAARARVARQGREWTRRRYGMARQLSRILSLLP